MKQNIIAGFIMFVLFMAGISADSFAQPGRKNGHHKDHHKHNKHYKHRKGPDRVVHHHHYYDRRPAYRSRTVVVPAPAPRRVYAPAPRVVAPPVPVVVIPRNAPVPPLPPHPGIRRR